MKVFGILLAAGLSERFESDKLFVTHEDKELIRFPIETFLNNDEIESLVVVCNENNIENMKNIFKSYDTQKEVEIIYGGKTRHESEVLGLNTLKEMHVANTDLVAIHDCARSFLPEELLKELIIEAKKHGTCSPFIETKLFDNSKKELSPDSFVEIQTPQIFEYEVLQKAYLNDADEVMNSHDTTQQVSKILGLKSKVILGSDLNLKITYKEDLEILKLKLRKIEN